MHSRHFQSLARRFTGQHVSIIMCSCWESFGALQAAASAAGRAWLLVRCMQALAGVLLVLQTLQALGALPSVGVITSALAAALVPFCEILLVILVLMVPMALLVLLMGLSDERMTSARHLASYMMNGAVVGTYTY